jgi:hypothetical protein
MKKWINLLKYNPIDNLLSSKNYAIVYYTRRDLLEQKVSSISDIWNLKEPQQILRKMNPNGFWKSKSQDNPEAPAMNYNLFETFKNFLKLVEMYEFNNSNYEIVKIAEYLFSCQTEEGDFRGIIGNQYAPYYTGLIMYLLIKAGYVNDERILKGFDWLLRMRQNDGGWVIGSPGCFGKYTKSEKQILTSHNVETKKDFDKTKPFAHSGTGMVIKAFAIHPVYNKSNEAKVASNLLKSHFFKKDNYNSYKAADNWVNFKFPYFWTDLISALDSVTMISIDRQDTHIDKAIHWLVDNQQKSGLWKHSYSKIHKYIENDKTYEIQLWITLSICRILKRVFDETDTFKTYSRYKLV